MSVKTYVLKLVSAIAVEGQVLRPGHLVELIEKDAKDLLARGKAVLHDVEEAIGLGDDKPADTGGDVPAADDPGADKSNGGGSKQGVGVKPPKQAK